MASTILVVHDEPSLSKLLRIRLENEGISAREVNDPREAPSEIASAGDQIAAVISGVRMTGLSGLDLLAGIRDVNPEVPVFFFSSHPLSADSAVPPGVRIFAKPHELNELIQAVRKIVAHRAQTAGRK